MNVVYSKEGLLFLVQDDHLSGELLGSAIEYLYAVGARNVQRVPSVTKKNRPGQAIFIDAPVNLAQGIERLIVEELASTGWHRIKFEGGCHGDLQGLGRLAEGRPVEEVIYLLSDIKCGKKRLHALINWLKPCERPVEALMFEKPSMH